MGKIVDKIRQAFNLFLIMFLIAAAAAVFIYFLTTPEQRGTTFWMSMGFLAAALILCTLFASRIAMRGASGRAVPGHFAQLFLMFGWFIFVIAASVLNAFKDFSSTTYLLIHIGGLLVFILPLVMMNMAMLKQESSEVREQRQGRVNMNLRAARLADSAKNINNFNADLYSRLNKLADDLRYADPTPAAGNFERNLDEALSNLNDELIKIKSADADVDNIVKSINERLDAAQRALSERNAQVLYNK